MNPIATQTPEEIPAPLTYITLRRADFLTDCSLTGVFVKDLPDSFPNGTGDDATTFCTGQPHAWACLSSPRVEQLLAVSGGREHRVESTDASVRTLECKEESGKVQMLV